MLKNLENLRFFLSIVKHTRNTNKVQNQHFTTFQVDEFRKK